MAEVAISERGVWGAVESREREPITSLEDLVGKWVKVVSANEEEMKLQLPDGRIVTLWPDYSCTYDDCSGSEDPWPYLDFEEVGW